MCLKPVEGMNVPTVAGVNVSAAAKGLHVRPFPAFSDLGQLINLPFASLSLAVNGDNDTGTSLVPRGAMMFEPKCF